MRTLIFALSALLFVPVIPAWAQEKRSPKQQTWSSFCCWEKGRINRGDLVSVVYDIHHKNTKEFHRVLSPFVTKGKGRIEYSDSLQTLVLTDTKENIGKIEELFQMIHHDEPPIQIEAKVVEIKWTKGLQIGVTGDFGATGSAMFLRQSDSATFLREIRTNLSPQEAITSTPFQGSTFRFNRVYHGDQQIGGLIEMFQKRGKAQILSQPRILVKADETAKFFAGDEVPYPKAISINSNGTTTSTYAYRQSGISLEVTPHMAAPGQIILKIKPEVTTTLSFVTVTGTIQAPEFSVRRVETEIIVRDGQEVVIGGLYRKETTHRRRGIPFLMDIPLLGYLFSKLEEDEVIQEILFFIKPTVIRGRMDLPKPLIDPGK